MKIKNIAVAIATLGAAISLVGCGGSKGEISLWVGNESVEFYDKVVKEYLANNADFGYNVKVVASDAGTIAGSMLADNTACGDIITIAHDNIGKLAQKSYIKALTDEALLAQIEADNPDTYLKDGVSQGYGIYSSESNHPDSKENMTLKKVVKLADKRMYHNKELLKESGVKPESFHEHEFGRPKVIYEPSSTKLADTKE